MPAVLRRTSCTTSRPPGLRFVLTTDLAAADMRETLRYIYLVIYVGA